MTPTTPVRDHAFRLTLLALCLVIGYFGIATPLGLFDSPRLATQDQWLRGRSWWQPLPAAARDLVLVTIDDRAMAVIGQRWPWDRTLFAQLLQTIGAGHPRAIVLDLALVGASTAEADATLAHAIHEHSPVFLASYLDPQGRHVLPHEAFLNAGGIPGLINKPRDRDLVVRRLWPAMTPAGTSSDLEYALEVKAAAVMRGRDAAEVARTIPTIHRTMLVNPFATLSDLPHVSCADVLAGHLPSDTFTGKLVLVGTTTEITHDIYPTALGLMPGVLLSANGLLTIVSQRYLTPVPAWLLAVGGLLLALTVSASAFFLPTTWGVVATLGLAGAAAALTFGAAWFDRLADWFTPVTVAGAAWLAGTLYRYGWTLITGRQFRVRTLQETKEALVATARVLVRALETKDPYTAGHSERVSQYAARLAERLQLPADRIDEIREAGLLHDIGKIGLPEEVLHKVGPLDDHERAALRQHHAEGSHILEPLKPFKRIIPLIYSHHERYDGKGFPHGLAGDLIPLGAQIIAIVDAFDAMTTHRGYNVPMPTDQALAELERCAGTQFNPAFAQAFVRMIHEEGV